MSNRFVPLSCSRPRSRRAALASHAALLAFALSLSVGTAYAGLTSSEREQVRQFVATAQPANAARVRALVARTDLTTDESAASLREALSPLAFTDARAAFVRELLFGGASAPARSALAPVVVRGLLARADAVYAKAGADLETNAGAIAELTRIYAFVDTDIANTGRPQGLTHDRAAAIADTSLDECAKALAEHLAARPTLLKSQATLDAPMTGVRAQAHLALADLMNDAPTRGIDLAERLGLVGGRKSMLTDTGVLVLDSSKADEARIVTLRALLDRAPAARAGVTAFFFGDGRASLRSRIPVVLMKSALEGASTSGGTASTVLAWPDDVEAGPLDPSTSELALEIATLAVRRAFAARPDLRARADADARDADARDAVGEVGNSLGKPRDASTEATIAAAVARLMIDGSRAVDLAAVRAYAGKRETAAILSDALGVLAWSGDASAVALQVGRATGSAGPGVTATVTDVRRAANGGVLGFKLDGHTWDIAREDAGRVSAMTRDGVPITLTGLATARIPVTDTPPWQDGKVVFTRLQGSPRAGVAPGGRVRVVGASTKGVDAIVTSAPGSHYTVEADVRVEGDAGGLVVRAMSDRGALRGVSLLITPGSPARAILVASDGSGNEIVLARAVDLPATKTFHVRLTARSAALDAVVAGVTMRAAIPVPLAGGDVAIRAKAGATVEVSGLVLTRVGATK